MSVLAREHSHGIRRENISDYYSALGLTRVKLINYEYAIKFRDAFNGSNGEHLLTFNRFGFVALRRTFGSSFAWIMCNPDTSVAAHTALQRASSEFHAFINGDESSVTVCERRYDECSVILYPKTICCKPRWLLDGDITLLIPTGAYSPRLDPELHLRIDITINRNTGSWVVRNMLFSTPDGESIAGLGDVDMYIEGIEDLQPALKVAFNGQLDLLDVNAKMASGILRHDYVCPNADRIEIALGNENRDVSMTLRHTDIRTWYVEITIDGATYALPELAPESRFSIDPDEAMAERKLIEEEFLKMPFLDHCIDYDTVFDEEHVARLPHEMRELFAADPATGIRIFVDELNNALSRFKANRKAWITVPFYKGRERDLEYAGDATTTRIQLCAPLFLTEEDRRLQRASSYAICEFSVDPTSKKRHCWVPSILDAPTATADANNLRRALSRDYSIAA